LNQISTQREGEVVTKTDAGYYKNKGWIIIRQPFLDGCLYCLWSPPFKAADRWTVAATSLKEARDYIDAQVGGTTPERKD
jgi:hypothetical protein